MSAASHPFAFSLSKAVLLPKNSFGCRAIFLARSKAARVFS
jgi:hypothetical protein